MGEEKPETLVNALAGTLPHVETEIQCDTLAEVKTDALLDALADKIPESLLEVLEVETTKRWPNLRRRH